MGAVVDFDVNAQRELQQPRGSYNQDNYVNYIWDTPSLEIKSIFTRTINNLSNSPIANRDNANEYLAGQIQEEYNIPCPSELVPYFSSLAAFYNKAVTIQRGKQIQGYLRWFLDSLGCSSTPPLKVLQLWVNFQKKYEYNPPHSHSGVLSFVYYHKVPYYIEDEMKRTKAPDNLDGHFCFLWGKGLEITSWRLAIDKRWEGKLLMFPSTLNHTVYPFYTSNEYRVTLAGNLMFDI